jgi:hypothetical protein
VLGELVQQQGAARFVGAGEGMQWTGTDVDDVEQPGGAAVRGRFRNEVGVASISASAQAGQIATRARGARCDAGSRRGRSIAGDQIW